MSEGERDEGKEPGASRHGNFINYYKFHPADERVRQLPQGVWQLRQRDRKYMALDVGCNAGDLTSLLHKFLSEQLSEADVHILGIDLDPILIARARENCHNTLINFECLDFFSQNRETFLKAYLNKFQRAKFDVIFCFSITMWIHLNHGDEGLVTFLEEICRITEILVVEPQPWKCYRSASRRLRRSGEEDFPLINELKFTGDLESHIERIVCGEKCGFKKMLITEDNNWGRKLLIFERVSS